MSADQFRPPWEWRKASGGWTTRFETHATRVFHAYDETDRCACEPHYGLAASCETPNEGSYLCAACMAVVERLPGGRHD